MLIRATRGLAICRAKAVPSFISYFETLSIGLAPGIEAATSRFAVKRSTDRANLAAVEVPITTQSIAGLKGVANIADDLVVHEENGEEHGKNLAKVLWRLEEKNRTLNAGKCTFRLTKIVFMGLLLTKHEITN